MVYDGWEKVPNAFKDNKFPMKNLNIDDNDDDDDADDDVFELRLIPTFPTGILQEDLPPLRITQEQGQGIEVLPLKQMLKRLHILL